MGRARQPEIRSALIAECTDYALVHGLADRLEPFAAAAGTSTRMLIYHFGTKQRLQQEVLRCARQRQREYFGELLHARADEPYATTLRRAWPAMTRQQGRQYLDLFGTLDADAAQELWPGFRREATLDWLAPLEAGLGSLGRPELATLVLAVIRGLIRDLEATADTHRIDEAFEQFVDALPVGEPAG